MAPAVSNNFFFLQKNGYKNSFNRYIIFLCEKNVEKYKRNNGFILFRYKFKSISKIKRIYNGIIKNIVIFWEKYDDNNTVNSI